MLPQPISYERTYLPVAAIHSNPEHLWQERADITTPTSGFPISLLDSVRDMGIIEPLLVTERGDGEYQIIEGHRRFLCAVCLDLPEVPCIIYPKLDSGECAELRFRLNRTYVPWTQREIKDYLEYLRERGIDPFKLRDERGEDA